MSTSITFETAQLADSLSKANRLAPVKGEPFDKAAGFMCNVDPAKGRMTVRATDTDATYLQHVPAIEVKGDEATWRLPSGLLSGMVTSLPLDGDSRVTMIDRGDGSIRLTSNKWVSKINMIALEPYPIIREFSQEEMFEASDFAAKVEQVAWACDRKSPILQGVYIDGTTLYGCNQSGMACIPCPVKLDEPAIVPLRSLAVILSKATDVRLRAAPGHLQIALDAETQATARLIEGKYPDITRVMRDDFLAEVKVNKNQFLEALNRMLVLVREERMPAMQVTFDGTGLVKMITFDMDVPQVGRMQDSIDVSSDYDDSFSLHVLPQMFVAAVEHSRADVVDIAFGNADPEKTRKVPIRITDDHGYNSHIMPINRTT